MSRESYDDVITLLQQRKNTTHCNDAVRMLAGLGFAVDRRQNGNHHTYIHPGLPDFMGANFDCGHGKNPVIKSVYIGSILKVLGKYKAELTTNGANDEGL